MRFQPTALPGAYIIDVDPVTDERGFFARLYCGDTFRDAGLEACHAQTSLSFNARRGIIRGLHFQAEPEGDAKLVRCIRGAVYDVAVDLRPRSQTRGKWIGMELSDENRRAIYLPAGFAHGFQVLRDASEVLYQIAVPYRAELARGIRWDDPNIGVAWPLAEGAYLSARDRGLPFLRELSDLR